MAQPSSTMASTRRTLLGSTEKDVVLALVVAAGVGVYLLRRRNSSAVGGVASVTVSSVPTKPYAGQKPGTSGLRQKCTVVMQPNYLENFVQASFDSLPKQEVQGCTLVVAGDGRYYNDKATDMILRMCAANGVKKVLLGVNGMMSTPCVSYIIRSRKAYGGFILTASHNPGGPKEDFGIKYNCENGGPAPEKVTDAIYKNTLEIKSYKIAEQTPVYDITKPGTFKFGDMTIEVVDGAAEYAKLLKSIFDFPGIKQFLARPDVSMVFDAMHGVAGPFAKQIFIKELGLDASKSLLNADPKPDFGGGHPDPNLTYAHELVERMGLDPEHKVHGACPTFGAAADGDADRNMVLGDRFFVTPSDSLAVIAANAQAAIPYFKAGLSGVARSMPTSAAVDKVCEKKGLACYQVPTGWKFFGNLMDAGKIALCGEESFGTGSNHIREKDGLWAVMCWLSILKHKNPNPNQKLVTVKDIVEDHWKTYGRNYYSRYDYENVSTESAGKVMDLLRKLIADNKGKKDVQMGKFTLDNADEFEYKDPVDGSISSQQGVRVHFTDGSRFVVRLSGTGSVGATIRLYLEYYETNTSKIGEETASALKPLIDVALKYTQIQELTGRPKPTVIT
eukprot:gb/GEZN01002179.1/.p1 GENE.gb/GEZN01002179.1/~~gb/GEZN01002179.1/.p1  ORF type:complete len:618 (-),score=105.48 gb/GEZN01002179.1/:282-2135(-)